MNNNDILNVLHQSGENFELPENLSPQAVEDSLSGVKRKSKKGIVSACVTLSAVCLTVATVFITQNVKVSHQYDEVYSAVEAVKKANEPSIFEMIGDFFSGYEYYVTKDETSVYTSGSASANDIEMMLDAGSSSGSYSDTNVQVKGIDEADVAKTDGRYIYSIEDKEIFITNPNNGNPVLVSKIDTDYEITDLYIHENKLIALANGIDVTEKASTEDTANKIDEYGTSVIVYDITDVSSPVEVSILGQTGNCVSTRKIDNVIYLVTSYYVDDLRGIVKDEPETYCPSYCTYDEVRCVPADNISICTNVEDVQYITVASIDLDNPQKFADMQSVLGGGDNVYASFDNIYISAYSWGDGNKTEILRFSIDGTEIKENGSLLVEGTILNQFSMDEYNGYFRVVTEKTDEIDYGEYVAFDMDGRTTSLYVFDSDLKQIGKTENLAQGESVKSVRFDGDIAYFVTFRQTDPLFTVDISDPQNPKVLSELKIPGFSQYLHVMPDNKLLGFGRDADVLSGITDELKISMFDTSDKTDVSELATKIFGSENSCSEAEYNHKAIYVDEENFIIGIPYWSYDEQQSVFYSIFKYDTQKDEFVLIKTIEEEFATSRYFDYGRYIRGIKIDENFYLVTDKAIYAYESKKFEKTGSVNF